MSDNDLIRRGDAMRIMSDGDDIVRPDYPEWFINRYATINAIPAVQPTVKPLVWVEPKADGVFAERIWASEIYTIEKRNHAEVFDLYCSLWDGDNSVRFDTLEAAKAAAQADYEARILSALDMQPTVSPKQLAARPDDVAALVEAAGLLLDAYKAVLVLHRVMDKHGLTAGASAAENIADRIVAAHPEFPGLCALRGNALARVKG